MRFSQSIFHEIIKFLYSIESSFHEDFENGLTCLAALKQELYPFYKEYPVLRDTLYMLIFMFCLIKTVSRQPIFLVHQYYSTHFRVELQQRTIYIHTGTESKLEVKNIYKCWKLQQTQNFHQFFRRPEIGKAHILKNSYPQ